MQGALKFLKDTSGAAEIWFAMVLLGGLAVAAINIKQPARIIEPPKMEVRSESLVYDNSGQAQGINGGDAPQYVWLLK